MYAGIIAFVLGVAIFSIINPIRLRKRAVRFLGARASMSDADFLSASQAHNSILAINVRKLTACIVEIPPDYIYPHDCAYALTAQLNPRMEFTDRFHDFAMFSLPDNFEISESETVAQIIKRLEDLNVSGT